jgi:hypothetical protein
MNAGSLLSPQFQRSLARSGGLLLAIVLILVPAFSSLAWLASPPLPMGVLWAAYGWAAQGEAGWRAPLGLVALGLLQDQIAGGPLGFFTVLYLAAFLIGRVIADATRSFNMITEWAGFAAAVVGVGLFAQVLGPWALGGGFDIVPFVLAGLVTVLLFPLVRPLYMVRSGG